MARKKPNTITAADLGAVLTNTLNRVIQSQGGNTMATKKSNATKTATPNTAATPTKKTKKQEALDKKLYYAVINLEENPTIKTTKDLPTVPLSFNENWKNLDLATKQKEKIFHTFTAARCFCIYYFRDLAVKEKDAAKKTQFSAWSTKYFDMHKADVK